VSVISRNVEKEEDPPVEQFGSPSTDLKLGQGQGSQSEDAQKPRGDRNNRNNREDRGDRGVGDRMERGDRGDRRGKKRDNQDQPAREFNFNPNSNYRIYYLNDPLFYEVVIKKEEAPYEFKIHLFLDGDSSMSHREITT